MLLFSISEGIKKAMEEALLNGISKAELINQDRLYSGIMRKIVNDAKKQGLEVVMCRGSRHRNADPCPENQHECDDVEVIVFSTKQTMEGSMKWLNSNCSHYFFLHSTSY